MLGGRDAIEESPSMTSQASIVVGITTTFDLSDGSLIGQLLEHALVYFRDVFFTWIPYPGIPQN